MAQVLLILRELLLGGAAPRAMRFDRDNEKKRGLCTSRQKLRGSLQERFVAKPRVCETNEKAFFAGKKFYESLR